MATERERAVYVGCAYPGVRVYTKVSRQGKHQAFCSCGWLGPRRRKPIKALEDEDRHLQMASGGGDE